MESVVDHARRLPNVKQYQLILKNILYTPLYRSPNKEIVYRNLVRYTYRTFAERVRRVASSLQRIGVKPGMKVGVIDWNTNQYLELMFAVPSIGAVLHTINLRLPPEQIVWTTNYLEDDFLVVRDEFLPLAENLVKALKKKPLGIIVTGDEPKTPQTPLKPAYVYEDLVKEGSPSYELPDLDENTTALIYFTSGTTGLPKCVYFSHRQLVLQAVMNGFAATAFPSPVRIDSTDVIMHIPPFFHGYGWSLPYLATMLGMKQVLPGRYDPKVMLDLIRDEGVTFAAGVVRFIKMLLEHPDVEKYREALSRLKFLQDGEHGPRELYLTCRRYGIKMIEAFGMSEGVGYTFATLKDHMVGWDEDRKLEYINKAGLPTVFCHIRVVDSNGRDVPWDGKTPGEVWVKSAGLTLGYYNDPERTKESWTEDGWFKTGDVGVIDEEGYLLVIDRAKDVVKSGGEWIPTVMLEDLLVRHPAVKEAAVIAVRSEKWSERPLAVVVLKPEYEGKVSEEDLRAHMMGYVAQGKIAKFWVPDKFVFAKQLPLTSVGKTDKKVLREQFKGLTLP